MAVGGEFTKQLLIDAGVPPGARVLDIGCGNGEVSLMAAELAGPEGEVIGIDRKADILENAKERAKNENVPNCKFIAGDLDNLPEDLGVFDIITGRRVLMYLPEPATVVCKLSALLRSSGLMVFHEHDATVGANCAPSLPLHQSVRNWIIETLKREGADIRMGANLYSLLTQSGLTVEHVRAQANIQTPTQTYPLAEITTAILPRMVANGVVTRKEAEIETLAKRLNEEQENTNEIYIGDMMYGAWARKSDGVE